MFASKVELRAAVLKSCRQWRINGSLKLGYSQSEAETMVTDEIEHLRSIAGMHQLDTAAAKIAARLQKSIEALLKYVEHHEGQETSWPGPMLVNSADRARELLEDVSYPKPLTELQSLVSWLACNQVTRSGKHVESKDMARMCVLGGYWPPRHSEDTVDGLLRRIENDVNHHRKVFDMDWRSSARNRANRKE